MGGGEFADKANAILSDGGGASAPPPDGKRPRGRPKGSKTRRDGDVPPAATAEPVRTYVPNEVSIRGATALGATVWKLAGTMAGFRSLTVDEARTLGEALDPVLFKYVPKLAEWQAEVNLLIVVSGLIQATRIARENKRRGSVEEIGGTDSPDGADSRFREPGEPL